MISVIVADDDADCRTVLCMMLGDYPDIKIIAEVADGNMALEAVAKHKPDAIFLDIDMPRMSGLEVAQNLQEIDPLPYIVFITGRREHAITAFELEASDYIVKPIDEARLEKCVVRLASRVSTENQSQEAEELEVRIKDLEHASNTDPLLKIYNRRFMDQRIQSAVAEVRANNADLSCVMLDLDHFKAVNDNHGHQIGDLVLQQLCDIIKNNLRPEDLLARYGGEEFLLLLHNSNRATAAAVAERIRAAVEANKFGRKDKPLSLTISLGVAAFQNGDEPDTLIERADLALYEAKRSGRNKAHID